MILSIPSGDAFRSGLGMRGVDDESSNESAKVEAVSEGCEVVGGVLEGKEGAGQSGPEVALHRVDPYELGQVAGLARANGDEHVNALSGGYGGEAAQPIPNHDGRARQMRLGPVVDSFQRKARHRRELEVQRMTLVIERDGDDEENLVLSVLQDSIRGVCKLSCPKHLYLLTRQPNMTIKRYTT